MTHLVRLSGGYLLLYETEPGYVHLVIIRWSELPILANLQIASRPKELAA